MKNALVNIETVVPSQRNSIQLIEPFIFELKDRFEIDDEKFYNILIAITEAVNNAIMHGNKYSPDKIVKFYLQANNQEIEVIVIDEGNGFDPESIADPREPENLFRAHGRGVFLIRELTSSYHYTDNGRKVTMYFSLDNDKEK
jgi:serine/threonine-protein kinase RsbW